MPELDIFEIIKIAHIVAVISWFAGLLSLPRIFVYHSQVAINSETDKIFQVMDRKLLYYIMYPAMTLTIAFGLSLGLGSKDVVHKMVDEWYIGLKKEMKK